MSKKKKRRRLDRKQLKKLSRIRESETGKLLGGTNSNQLTEETSVNDEKVQPIDRKIMKYYLQQTRDNPTPNRLIRFLNKKYNPLRGGTTIKLGTFDEYRRIEKGNIGDKEEGIANIYQENYEDRTRGIQYAHNYYEGKQYPNSLMFCASTEDVGGDIFDSDYDDKYQ